MRVNFLLEHSGHVERVAHRVEAQDLRQLTKTGPLLGADLTCTLGAGIP